MAIKKRKYVFLSKWDNQELTCACLFHSPCCKYPPKECEEIEFSLSPYENLEECMRNQRSFRRHNGALRQK